MKKSAMQDPLFCATCTAPLEFSVPELIDNRWYVGCTACGKRTLVEANPNVPGEDLATFHTAGVYTKVRQR